MSVGVVVRESPQGGGSRSATHPAYKIVLGEGKEVEAQATPAQAAPCGDPEQWKRLGVGKLVTDKKGLTQREGKSQQGQRDQSESRRPDRGS